MLALRARKLRERRLNQLTELSDTRGLFLRWICLRQIKTPRMAGAC